MSYYVHNVPGRLRVRSAQIKRNTCQADNLCAILKNLDGIHSTEINKKAGSLLVHYDPNLLTADDILYTAHKSGCLDKAVSSSARSSRFTNTAGAMIGHAIFGTVVKKSVQASMFSLLKVAFR